MGKEEYANLTNAGSVDASIYHSKIKNVKSGTTIPFYFDLKYSYFTVEPIF